MTTRKLIFISIIFTFLFFPAAEETFANEIHEAASKGNLKKVKELVETSPDLVSLKDSDNKDPIYYAAMEGHIEVVDYLISKDAATKKQAEFLLLCGASKKGDIETIKLLESRGVHLRKTDSNYLYSALFHSIKNNQVDTVKYLLSKVDSISKLDFGKDSLLSEAVLNANETVIRLLLDKGINVNGSPGFALDTPLNCAVKRGDTAIISLLISRGADLNQKDYLSKGPIDYADNDAMYYFLIKQGVEPDFKDYVNLVRNNKWKKLIKISMLSRPFQQKFLFPFFALIVLVLFLIFRKKNKRGGVDENQNN